VVATPDGVLRPNGQDDWIAREIDEFSRGPSGHNLLLVRGAGTFDGPLPGDLLAQFPHIEIIDLRDVGRFWFLNPLRASRISDEKFKPIAPIVGIPAQDMPVLRREQERIQQARIGAVAGAMLTVFLTISGLTVYVLLSAGAGQRRRVKAPSLQPNRSFSSSAARMIRPPFPRRPARISSMMSAIGSMACEPRRTPTHGHARS
jgi:hypothetical protein